MTPSPPDAPDTARLRLAQALQRARWAIAWERLWPHLARVLTVVGLFLAASWAGLWLALPFVGRMTGVGVFALILLASLVPMVRFRWPTREDALRRLDRGAGIPHRPATALTDTLQSADPVAMALWQAQRERTLAALKRIRAGLPSPRLPLHDPWALRGLVVVLMAATFVAAGGERVARIASAFDWNGLLASPEIRVDAWITPPAYTGRPPVILSVTAGRETPPAADGAGLSVPAGSTLIVRTSASKLEVAISGGVTEVAPAEDAPKGSTERRFTIAADGSAHVRSPSGQPTWTFRTQPDRAPSIALAKDPERQARGALLLAYKIEDDYGVTEAHAQFAAQPDAPAPAGETAAAPRPLFDPPQFPLVLPNARTRNGVGQTVKDLSEHPFAGAEVTLTLTARDEAGNEGRSEPFTVRLPERVFAKPLPRALIELRRMLALDANRNTQVYSALDALLIAPELFTPELGQYLGLRDVTAQLDRARTDNDLREVVASLWALAVTIEDGNISDVEKALRAAQDALKQALDRGATDEEIKKLTEQLRAALDNYLRQLAEQLKNNPQQLARPLDPNTKMLRQQDLNAMIERMERLSRSGDKDAARQLLDQLQQMLENLQMAQPGQGGESDMEQSMNELGDVIRKQQQLRDRTFKQGQDSRRDRMRGQQGDQNAMNDLRQDQQALRDRLKKLLDNLNKQGMGPQQRGQRNPGGEQGQEGQAGQGDDANGLDDADTAMGDADGRLGDSNADGAVDAQGRALDALRRGAEQLAQDMQQMGDGQQGEGQGDRPGRQQGSARDSDPLGRPLRGAKQADDYSVKIPGEIDVQRARRILEELRRRLAEPQRPQVELDYIERLLKDY
ncbi:TIGR02302 family protein [Bradyrhizobium sp. U87765 SZCCT0131]|uniref:TIGR02302 family protein n=1 Tax=unclassified Bradyrhizobium TaxID=2631580 RepID=UPI001BAD12D7|nr:MULTISPECIES: TIGR02302 family protein [unclassified Bradyrhizobium]MBR1220725.1 TIGR02302 family protein [Bradyrhizobium sp. U87765 SZCCT0131]MBR1260455.1 TIGR02302 family protein [Bradyrhizobium sp. U87765 SZCCT0134]MBR1307296.1 TIGR02302 family protein [Bradyrhizobium sp. U87765 SZCCT0110]MBR1321250.1 TIGR02302 family protein [Bradyrhizobium sp. U87765 SZCCT0109]MBR1349563.1 TIGR02302 family protein [Bradyrhizobium sp. U87765 SZCCT0048]